MDTDRASSSQEHVTALRVLSGLGVGGLIVALCWHTSHLGDPTRLWAAVATVGAAVFVVLAVPAAYRAIPTPGALSCAQASCAVAVFGCVPETSNQMGYVFVFIGAGLAVELVTGAQLPLAWHWTVTVVVLWSGIYGATGRQSAFVGALFALWPLVIAPLVKATLRQSRGRRVSEQTWGVVISLGSIASVAVARTGALNRSIWPAVVAVAIAAPTSITIAALVMKHNLTRASGASDNVAS